MTDHEDIRKALDALNETEFTARCHAVDHLTRHAPQWLAELLAECEALTVKRDRYLHALELVAPDGRGLQLFLGEGPAPGMPMFGHSGAHDDVCDAVDVLSEYFDRTGGANA